MEKLGKFSLFLVMILVVMPHPLKASMEVTEHYLDNGLKILVFEDHTSPVFIGSWVAHVGSANETAGMTGLCHLLEHMMFKGTKTIGTTDPEQDEEIIEEKERIKDRMRELSIVLRNDVRRGVYSSLKEAQHTSPEYMEMQRQFDQLTKKQETITVDNEFSQIYKNNGCTMINAYTTEDYTAFFEMLPSNKLELWFWMESDRLFEPRFREFYTERSVVYEERRMRVESTAVGEHLEAINSMFWQAHPYSWPVLGWPSDVSELSMRQAKDYFRKYYSAENLTLVIGGDVSTEKVMNLARKYFLRLPQGDPPPTLVTMEPLQIGEKRYHGTTETNPGILIMFHCGGFGHKDSPTLKVISAVLEGETGRLQKRLVREKGLANDVTVSYIDQKYDGTFIVEADVGEESNLPEIEKEIFDILNGLKIEPVNNHELQKVKNNFLADNYREQATIFSRLFSLLSAEGKGNWREVLEEDERILNVTPEDIMTTAGKVFRKENCLIATITRESDEDRVDGEEVTK